MVRLTKDQQRALKRVYDRGPVYVTIAVGHERPMTYRQFRRTARPEFGGFGAVMVPWHGMLLGIERDGHTRFRLRDTKKVGA